MTSYLTTIPLNRYASGKWGRDQDAKNLHRDTMSLFGELPEGRSGAGILFRIDEIAVSRNDAGDETRGRHLIVRSSVEPDLDGANLGWARKYARTAPESPVPDRGETVVFQLDVNPVVRDGNKEHVINSDRLGEWLACRLSPGLEHVQITRCKYGSSGALGKGFIRTAKLGGIAKVADSEALGHLMVTGVGRARNYGCGLLTLQAL